MIQLDRLLHTGVAIPDSSGDKSAHRGSTVFGRQVISELNRPGVMGIRVPGSRGAYCPIKSGR